MLWLQIESFASGFMREDVIIVIIHHRKSKGQIESKFLRLIDVGIFKKSVRLQNLNKWEEQVIL